VVGGAVGSQRLCGRAQDIKNSCLTYGTPRFIPGHEPLPRPRSRVPFFPRLIIALMFHSARPAPRVADKAFSSGLRGA
jgi:hypothetical protein